MAGIFAVMFLIFEFIVMVLTDIFWPEQDIDIARHFDTPDYTEQMQDFGDHEFFVDNKDSRSTKQPKEIVTFDCSYSVEQDRISNIMRGRRFCTVSPNEISKQAKNEPKVCTCQTRFREAKKNKITQTTKVHSITLHQEAHPK